MSHTDKTRPIWVQFRDPDNRRHMTEVHHHEDGVCTFDAWYADTKCHQTWPWKWGYNCFLYHSYYGGYFGEFWPRCRKGSWDRTGRHGHVRTLWRKQRGQLLKGEIEDGDKPTSKWYKRDMWNEWSR